MKITNIQESGSSSILTWAISKGAVIRNDKQLASIINDELFYLVTLSDVNFFEAFRLTQAYRDKLRIINRHQAAVPSSEQLKESFSGTYTPDPNKPDVKAPQYEIVEHVCNKFINLVLQMETDSDIISPLSLPLFLPMISVKMDIQIPVSFIDIIQAITEEEYNRVFNLNYPRTLDALLPNEDETSFSLMIKLAVFKMTSIIRYDERYDKYINLIKYPNLNADGNKLYAFNMIGFHMYDNVTRGEVRCDLFCASADEITSAIKRMAWLTTPLKVEFAVQLPIHYMQILENAFDNDAINITYEASMNTILKGGLVYNDFITPEFYDTNDEDSEKKIEEHNNSISAYKIRISEANTTLVNALPMLLESSDDVDTTSAFSMLPPLYMTKAVITLDANRAKEYVGHSDPMISEMFSEMMDYVNKLRSDIANTQK